jgi:hypothetical protein
MLLERDYIGASRASAQFFLDVAVRARSPGRLWGAAIQGAGRKRYSTTRRRERSSSRAPSATSKSLADGAGGLAVHDGAIQIGIVVERDGKCFAFDWGGKHAGTFATRREVVRSIPTDTIAPTRNQQRQRKPSSARWPTRSYSTKGAAMTRQPSTGSRPKDSRPKEKVGGQETSNG